MQHLNGDGILNLFQNLSEVNLCGRKQIKIFVEYRLGQKEKAAFYLERVVQISG